MRLDQIAAQTMNLLLAPFLRRALAAAVFALFVLIALYHVTTAGTVALELRFLEHGAPRDELHCVSCCSI